MVETQEASLHMGASASRILLIQGARLPVAELRRRLEGLGGYEVVVAAGLRPAEEFLDRCAVDVVFLGPTPGGSSFEEALAALVERPAAPAVLVAGGPDNRGVAEWALGAGASGYLTEAELQGSRLARALSEVSTHRRQMRGLIRENHRILGRMESVERLFELVSEGGPTSEEQVAQILRLGCELFHQEIGIVSRVEGSRYTVLYAQAPPELELSPGQEFELGLTYCSITLARQQPVMIEHMGESDWRGHPCYPEQGLESYIGTRISLGEDEVGTLNFSSSTPRRNPFRSADRDLIVMMGTWISTLLVRQRLEQSLRESEELYRDQVENSSDLICTHDLEGNILSANRILVKTFGGDDDSRVVGHNLAEFLSPSVRDELPHYLEEVRRQGGSRGYMRVLDLEGRERILEYHNSLRREGVEEPVVRGIARDVTELKRAEAELRHSEAMLRLFVKHTPAAVAMFDREMRYLAVSDRWRVDYRLGGVDLLGRSHYEEFPELAEHWREVHRRCLEGGVEQADEDPLPRADGTLDWVRWEVRPWYTTGGDIGGLLMFTEVITDRKRVEEALRYLATHDHLTGLPNRAAFLERLERSVERARKDDDYGFALFFLDLDDFKSVNDTFGHAMGDHLVKQVAERLRRHLRPKDALARFAGDEFVGLLEDTRSETEATLAAERLLEHLRAPFRIQGRKLYIDGSIGIALSREGPPAEKLLQQADAAMYVAKGLGKGGWSVYPEESPAAPSLQDGREGRREEAEATS